MLKLFTHTNNIQFQTKPIQNKQTLKLKRLEKDCVSFSSKTTKQPEPDPYKSINQIATTYLKTLKKDFHKGLKFLENTIPNLTINITDIKISAAGLASIIPGKKPGKYEYEIDLNKNTRTIMDAAIHEGYHILQFEKDTDQKYIQIRKMIAKENNPDSITAKNYDTIRNIVIQHIFLKPFKATLKETIDSIKHAFKTNNSKLVNQINNEHLTILDKQILPPDLKGWFKNLPEKEHIEYIKSHAEIEIKAHTFCKNNDNKPIIYNRNDINISKLKDIIAIKIYREIAQLAENELLRR